MKKALISFLKLLHLLIIVVLFSLSLGEGWGEAHAQIVIEERVEIDPQKIFPNYPEPQYTPCGPYPEQPDFYNPYQVIWNGGWLYIDPYQQLFNHQGNDYNSYGLGLPYTYDVEITQGSEYCWIQKAGYTDPNTGEFIEPEVIGDQLLGISGEELIGTGQWLVLPGCFIDVKEYPSKYSIYFERDIPAGTEVIVRITGDGSTINYHTIVETPLLHLENGTGLDTLYHYYGRWIDVLAEVNENYYENRPYCWRCGGELPSSVTFNLEVIQGQEYGALYDVETDETALSFSGILTESGSGSLFSYDYGYRFKFIADGVQPDINQPGTVTIRCIPSDGDITPIEFSFPVAYNEYPPEQGILVQFAEPLMAPGDTTQIFLKRRNPDGTLEDFSQWDSFEIGMIDGCEAGQILVEGVLAPYFEEAYQPIYFVADGNLTETDTVEVRVGLIEGIGTRPVNVGGEEKDKNVKEPNPPADNPTTYCFIGEIVRDYIGDGSLVVGKLEIIIIRDNPIPQKNDVFITEEPAMPEITCKAKLNQEVQGTIKYEWKFIVRQEYRRKGKVPPNCTRISKCEFQGLSYSTLSDGYTEWTVPFLKDSGYFWFEAVGYKDNDIWGGCTRTFNYWYDTNTEIFTGGDVRVSIVAKNEYGNKIAEIENEYWGRILGNNPSITNARSYAGDNEISALMQTESKTHQFTYNPLADNFPYGYGELNYPEYGYPNGFGIMKLDNPSATERELWNWKANIDKGISIYTTKKQWAITYLNKFTSNIPDSIIKQSSFQKYNGGDLYSEYDDYQKEWIINPEIKKNMEEVDYSTGKEVKTYYQHGIFTWRRYQEIINP